MAAVQEARVQILPDLYGFICVHLSSFWPQMVVVIIVIFVFFCLSVFLSFRLFVSHIAISISVVQIYDSES